jgi:hypothetical protein
VQGCQRTARSRLDQSWLFMVEYRNQVKMALIA